MIDNNPLVSICCLSYNHEKFLKEAIESFLMQITDFPFEIIIHDDASTDGSSSIIKEYEQKFPHLFITICQTQNQYSQGIQPWPQFVFPLARGKYIALCEGDDYWTDPLKLQKQVDFLESHPDFVFVFHDASILNQTSGRSTVRIGDRNIDEIVDLESVIIQKNISTASLLFRNKTVDFDHLPGWYHDILQEDYVLAVLLAEKGPGKFMREVMSVYRIHDGGVWSGNKNDNRYMADETFYNCLISYFRNNKKVKKIILMKMHFLQFNWGVNLIRRGHYVKGLLKVVLNYRFVQDTGFL